eukprot:gene17453-23005_t
MALAAAAVLAVAPHALGGIRLRGPAGTVRDAWLDTFRNLLPPETPVRRMPAAIGDGRLLGGLDLAATLQSGRPVAESGLLSETDEGILIMAMAERISAATAAKIAMVMDRGMAATERDGITVLNPARFGVVALDEGLDEDEQPPRALTERLALIVDLRTVSHRDLMGSDNPPTEHDRESIAAARHCLTRVIASTAIMTALCSASMAMGIGPLRASLQALQAARVLAALASRDSVAEEDAAMAAMLVLAPRATQLPAPAEAMDEESPKPEEPQQEQQDQAPEEPAPPQKDTATAPPPPLEDVVLDAAVAAIPAGLLALLQSAGQQSASRAAGRAGKSMTAANRGRVIGSRLGDIRSGARLDVVETLRTAAPWQRLRRHDQAVGEWPRSALAIRREDFRIVRYKQRTQTTTVFVVDASGSSALQRLAEAKGAVRLLLADCYIRRDEVAMIAFRGRAAELILPPTRALARAQRALAALPGGGGTPIAAAIDAASDMVDAVRRSGRTPAVVFMTDGRANITRAGTGGRAAAQDEARSAASALRLRQCGVILIDTSPQPQPLAAELAGAMGARYVPLPHADARRVAQAVTALREDADGRDWPNREASRFVEAGGLRWHVQISGQEVTRGRKPVLLLLHGTGASTHSWRGLFPLLAERFTVVAPDLPGHGFTGEASAEQLSLPGMARAVTALLEDLNLQPACIAGHSAGAAIALRMCLDTMVTPRAVISINGALRPFGGMAAQLFPVMARMLAFNPFVQRFVAARAEDKAAVIRLIEGTGSRLDADGLEFYRRLFSTQSHVAAALGMMASWDLAGLQRDLPRLTQPLTLIVGEADKAVPPEDARIVRQRLPKATILSMRGAGHLCHEERPEEAVRMIMDACDEPGMTHDALLERRLNGDAPAHADQHRGGTAEQQQGDPKQDDPRPHAIVIGSGFGGLAAAIRLGARGYRVTILEQLDQPGGRARVFRQDGFTFDAGPTIVTAPFLFEELWSLCGRRMADHVTLKPMTPFYRLMFADGTQMDCSGDDDAMREQISRIAPDDVAGYERLLIQCEKIYGVGFEELAHIPFTSLIDMAKAIPKMAMLRADRSLYTLVSRYIRDERLRLALSFHPLFIGGNPFSVTAIYALVLHLERRFGVHYAMGGTGQLVSGLVSLLEGQGADLRLNTTVTAITLEGRKATGVTLASGETLPADIIVSNGCTTWTYQNLLPDQQRRRWSDRKIRKVRHSMSVFVWYFGTNRRYEDVLHHTILLGPRYKGLLEDIFKNKVLADDFSLYLHRPSASDPSVAPEGRDAFYVLAPVPNLEGVTDWSEAAEPYRQKIEDFLAASILPGLADALVTSRVMTPLDFRDELLSTHGAAFGIEPVLTQSAWFRPHNQSEDIDHLYFVGAGTHPGAGMPGVLSSARVLDSVHSATDQAFLGQVLVRQAASSPQEDLAACRVLLKGGSRSFHAASFLLPRAARDPATALYAFCRLADDAVDEGEGDPEVIAKLRLRVERIFAADPLPHPVDRAFARVVREHGLPQLALDALIEGFTWDAAGRRYRTFADVQAYAARVAGCVGIMMTAVMARRGYDVLARAADLGVAMQLTNIARDVGEDARNGRLYLPLDWLEEAGIDPDVFLANPEFSPALGRIVKRLLDEAEVLYARADAGIALLPAGCRCGIRAARLIYAAIGHEVARRGFDSVSSRTVVPFTAKLPLLARSLVAAPTVEALRRLPALQANRFLVEAVMRTPAYGAFSKGRTGVQATIPSPAWWNLAGRFVLVLSIFEKLERVERTPALRQGAIALPASIHRP